mgnify:CR=1 FL=1
MNEDALLAFGAAVVTTTPWIPTNIALFAETTPGVLALAVRETPGTFFTPGIPAIVGVYSLSTLLPFGDDAVAACRRYEGAGVDLLLCLVNPYKITHEKVMQTIDLFGSEVIPEFT